MLEDIVTNLANHLQTGQIPKPYRRGSWRPIGHMRPSSPLLDSVRDLFEGYDQLTKDFGTAFNGNTKMICDVAFKVTGHPTNGAPRRESTEEAANGFRKIYGVRAILAIRSRIFLEMLYGFSPPGVNAAANALSAASKGNTPPPNKNKVQLPLELYPNNNSGSSSKKASTSKTKELEKKAKEAQQGGPPERKRRTSITAETMHKIAQIPKIIQTTANEVKARRKDSIAALKTPTYLTVPGTSNSAKEQQQTSGGGGIKAAFSRLVSGSWAGWGSKRTDSMKRWQSESIYAKLELAGGGGQDGLGAAVPGLSVCADVAKIDRNKLAQTEVCGFH